MSKLLALIVAPFLLIPVSAQTPAAAIASRITANGLKADVSFLASDALQGRGTPSPGLDVAAEFIASQFRRAGLEPGGDDGYFQTAQYANVTPNLDGFEMSVVAGGQTFKIDKAAVVMQNQAAGTHSGPALKVMAEAKAMGAITAAEVKGKVVLLVAQDPPGRVSAPATILNGQASLLVFVRAGQPQAGAVRAQLREVPGQQQTAAITIYDAALRSALAASPDATVEVKIPEPKSEPMKLRNVVGVLRGSDPVLKDTYVLLTAHYDHLGTRTTELDRIYNGANDNASGTSCVLEIAASLAAAPQRPKRTLVFMTVFGEELGLVGSRYYGRHPIFPLAKTVADINLEQMGRTDSTEGPNIGQMNATGFDYTSLVPELALAGEEFGVKLLKDEQNSDRYYSASDNQALADVGVPSTTLSVTYEFPDYHKVGDEWPKIDYDNMAKVAQTVAVAVYRVADDPKAPEWNLENSKTERYVKAREATLSGK